MRSMPDVEGLGVFYLGREFEAETGQPSENLLLYEANDLTTHAVCVGMTGSGKTGLGIGLLEEAALDGVPALVIDPKGDLGNLLLTFPELQAEDFRPWIDEAEAARQGLSPATFAAQTAAAWKAGLAEWGQDGDRIRRLRNAVDMTLYTPGNTTGRPLAVLRSFAVPGPEVIQEAGALRDRVLSVVGGLLALIGVTADPVRSRDHILLSNLLEQAWRSGRSLDLAGLIREIQKPPFATIGVLDLETFYPAKERLGLAMALNNLLAAPGFQAWLEGEPLEIQQLLYTSEGRPRLAILSLAHLSEPERLFFVTTLLGEVVAWMRRQPGTSSLRALLYMDEIHGYFPPTANPPAKPPMLTLLKQARAYGLGVVLATQNPADLDYKALANAGTWFIGRLQTERDRLRVLEGLEGALAHAGSGFDRGRMEALLAGLGRRVFLLRNVHEEDMVLFQTRWTLSYLRGPMTLPQIRSLLAAGPAAAVPTPETVSPSPPPGTQTTGRPVVPPELSEFFERPASPAGATTYRAMAIGLSRLHFVDARASLDVWVSSTHVAPLADEGRQAQWDQASVYGEWSANLVREPAVGATFEPLPPAAAAPRVHAAWRKTLETHLHQNATFDVLQSPRLKLVSKPGESEGDFRARIAVVLRERRDAEVANLRTKYAGKLETLGDQLRRAREREDRERAQVVQHKLGTAVSFGATLLGALLGRRKVGASTVHRAASTLRSAGRLNKEAQDVTRAVEGVAVLEQRLEELNTRIEAELRGLHAQFEPAAVPVERRAVRPRKSDITIQAVGLLWALTPPA